LELAAIVGLAGLLSAEPLDATTRHQPSAACRSPIPTGVDYFTMDSWLGPDAVRVVSSGIDP